MGIVLPGIFIPVHPPFLLLLLFFFFTKFTITAIISLLLPPSPFSSLPPSYSIASVTSQKWHPINVLLQPCISASPSPNNGNAPFVIWMKTVPLGSTTSPFHTWSIHLLMCAFPKSTICICVHFNEACVANRSCDLFFAQIVTYPMITKTTQWQWKEPQRAQ